MYNPPHPIEPAGPWHVRNLTTEAIPMDFGLEGKLAFVGGASRGIGKAIALELARGRARTWQLVS